MTLEHILVILGLAGSVGGFLWGKHASAKRDSGADGEWRGELRAELRNINARLDGLDEKFDKTAEKTDGSIRRLHKRIDDHLRHEHKLQLPQSPDDGGE